MGALACDFIVFNPDAEALLSRAQHISRSEALDGTLLVAAPFIIDGRGRSIHRWCALAFLRKRYNTRNSEFAQKWIWVLRSLLLVVVWQVYLRLSHYCVRRVS